MRAGRSFTSMMPKPLMQIGAAQARKAQLEAEIAQLQATQDGWVKAGMLGKLERCGPKARPCVRVDEGAGGFGDRGDYRVILGY
jgi:hypothetical protein